MPKKLTFSNMQDYQIVFRIGLFLPYTKTDMTAWRNLRDNLRRNGFPSAFLVQDYSMRGFNNEREKSFFFLKNCHVSFFIIEKTVGKGGVVSELEEYKREVYPKKGKVSAVFERCQFAKDRIADSPSTVIAPNLTEEKFFVRRFAHRNELPEMTLGMAKSIFYGMLKNPRALIDIPEHRLLCQRCKKADSVYICVSPCAKSCSAYHLCEPCHKAFCKRPDMLCVLPY